MKQIPFYDVTLKDGFWADQQQKVRDTTVWAVYDRFVETGRIGTMDCEWKEGMPNKPHVYWGSDVFKWLEGAAYLLAKQPDDRLRAAVDSIIDDIEHGMREDGYYNSCYNATGQPRFTERGDHELYSVGHMLEAGVAMFLSTGDDRLLRLCRRNADLVDRIFREEGSAAFVTPGHEEIELALVRLAETTGEERYLKLADFFVRMRGSNDKDKPPFFDAEYSQEDTPAVDMTVAKGHAVRAVYFYCAMADLAEKENDPALMTAVKRLFDDIYGRQMYITGGIGALAEGEAFSGAYQLPNREAYTETCAALGFALFCRRLYNITPDGRYGDAAERALYNGMLSGLSMSGDAFFYENPLEIDLSAAVIPSRIHRPDTRRQKVFGCSCCPPNLVRLIPSVGDFIYGTDGDRLFVHQYIANTAVIDGVSVSLDTRYPTDGQVAVSAPGKKLVLRRPAWCEHLTASAPYTERDGYLYFETDRVEVCFDMTPRFVAASSRVRADRGRVALMRGPIVYCVEGQDQPAPLSEIRVDPDAPISVADEFVGGLPVLRAAGCYTTRGGAQEPLYAAYRPVAATPCTLRYIPYYTFANRAEDDMQVWVCIR